MNQRVLVCGGRDYTDKTLLFGVLDAAHRSNPIELLIHGAASGADTLAGEWADDFLVPTREFPAEWKAHGRAAGPIRNKQMLDDGKPHLVIAFPGGRGTQNMIDQANARGIPVVTVKQDDRAQSEGASRKKGE